MNRKVLVVIETLLLVIFISATIILAQKLRFDPQKGFTATAGIRIDGIKHAQVIIDKEKRDDTPVTVDYLTSNQYDLKISKQNRTTWIDNISVVPQFITRVYPVLFPSKIEANVKIEDMVSVFSVTTHDSFFYTKFNPVHHLELHRYSLLQNLFGDSVEDKKIYEFLPADSIDKIDLIPSPTGQKAILKLGNNIYIINADANLKSLGNIVNLPSNLSTLTWSLNEKFLIFDSSNIIYSYDISSQQKYVVGQSDQNITYKFMDVTSNKLLLMRYENDHKNTALFQTNIDGTNPQKLNISNDLTNLQTARIYPNDVGLLLQISDHLFKASVDNLNVEPIMGSSVYMIDRVNNIIITKNVNKFEIYNLVDDTHQSINLDPAVIDNLSIYFKNSNFIFLNHQGKLNLLESSYVTGSNQTVIDTGSITPLISWKKSDVVRIFYARQKSNNNWSLNAVEFEN